MRVFDYVDYWAHRAPDRLAVADGVRTWTYAQVKSEAARFARVLDGLGVREGDRFCVLAKNCVEWAAIYQGSFVAGAIPVPLNYRLHPREWIHQAADSGAVAIVAQEEYLEAVETVRGELGGIGEFVAIGGTRGGWSELWDLMATASTDPLDRDPTEDHPLYIMYSSGTTGKPKGILLTHRAADNNLTQIRTALSLHPAKHNMLVMPLFHCGGVVNMYAGFAAGLSARIVADFEPGECVRMLDEDGITMASLAPAMIQAMLVSVPDVGERAYPTLETILYGASPIAEETLRRALEIFDCEFFQAYGQTEASALLTMLAPDEHRRALAGRPELLQSCGRPVVGTAVRVAGANGVPMPRGEIGEIVVRGPQLMAGYWNLPDQTADAIRGGWLHTGDAGYLDDEGYLYIRDRIKDMIVSGGENVYSREVEDVLFESPDIADAAVIGVPDQKWGEAVKAIVVPRPGAALDADDVIAWCRARIAGYKCPRSVDIVDELPRNAAGKVLKRVLRDPFWADRERQIG